MFNQNEEFFNEKLEEDDFPAEFFLQPENSHIPSIPQPEPPNPFSLFLENEHYSMDLSGVKSLKSQIINSDYLIESNERLKKRVQELELENKELKMMTVKAREQEQQKWMTLESKLKAAEMMNNQFKEQLALHSKENNPQINIAMRDKIKALEKTLKIKEEEIRRRDEEVRGKNLMLEEMKRHLAVKDQEIKELREAKKVELPLRRDAQEGKLKRSLFLVKKRLKKLKCRIVTAETTLKGDLKAMRKSNEEIRSSVEICSSESLRLKDLQESSLNEKLAKFKDELLQSLPSNILIALQDPETRDKIKGIFPMNPQPKIELEEPVQTQVPPPNPDLEKPLQAGSSVVSVQSTQQIEKANNVLCSPEGKPGVNESNLENSFETDSKIRKLQKKPSISKDFNELIRQKPAQPKDLLRAFFPFYFKKNFTQIKSSNEALSKPVFTLISQVLPILTSHQLMELIQENSASYEPFEVALAFHEFLADFGQVCDPSVFSRVLEGLKEFLKTPFILQWKWAMPKTKNARYLSEEKQAVFLDFFRKLTDSSYFEHLLACDPSDDAFESFKALQSMSPISFQLNNDLLDILTHNLLTVYHAKNKVDESLSFLYQIMTQQFCITRQETIINLIYSVILLAPKTLTDPEKPLESGKNYDISWIMQIGTAQALSPTLGPLTLQAIRLAIVDLCNHWKILNRPQQNAFLQLELHRKTQFILLRLYELLDKGQTSDVIFGLFNYENVRESFLDGLSSGKRPRKPQTNGAKGDDWPWFKRLNLDPLSLSSLLTNNLINILDQSLFYWDQVQANTAVNLGVLDLADVVSTMGLYMGHNRFFMTGLLQKHLLGFIYNKKYDLTFQRTFSLLSLSFLSKSGEKEIFELLFCLLQDRVPNVRVGNMDKVAALYCLWKRFNTNLNDLMDQNRGVLNQPILDMMKYLVNKR